MPNMSRLRSAFGHKVSEEAANREPPTSTKKLKKGLGKNISMDLAEEKKQNDSKTVQHSKTLAMLCKNDFIDDDDTEKSSSPMFQPGKNKTLLQRDASYVLEEIPPIEYESPPIKLLKSLRQAEDLPESSSKSIKSIGEGMLAVLKPAQVANRIVTKTPSRAEADLSLRNEVKNYKPCQARACTKVKITEQDDFKFSFEFRAKGPSATSTTESTLESTNETKSDLLAAFASRVMSDASKSTESGLKEPSKLESIAKDFRNDSFLKLIEDKIDYTATSSSTKNSTNEELPKLTKDSKLCAKKASELSQSEPKSIPKPTKLRSLVQKRPSSLSDKKMVPNILTEDISVTCLKSSDTLSQRKVRGSRLSTGIRTSSVLPPATKALKRNERIDQDSYDQFKMSMSSSFSSAKRSKQKQSSTSIKSFYKKVKGESSLLLKTSEHENPKSATSSATKAKSSTDHLKGQKKLGVWKSVTKTESVKSAKSLGNEKEVASGSKLPRDKSAKDIKDSIRNIYNLVRKRGTKEALETNQEAVDRESRATGGFFVSDLRKNKSPSQLVPNVPKNLLIDATPPYLANKPSSEKPATSPAKPLIIIPKERLPVEEKYAYRDDFDMMELQRTNTKPVNIQKIANNIRLSPKLTDSQLLPNASKDLGTEKSHEKLPDPPKEIPQDKEKVFDFEKLSSSASSSTKIENFLYNLNSSPDETYKDITGAPDLQQSCSKNSYQDPVDTVTQLKPPVEEASCDQSLQEILLSMKKSIDTKAGILLNQKASKSQTMESRETHSVLEKIDEGLGSCDVKAQVKDTSTESRLVEKEVDFLETLKETLDECSGKNVDPLETKLEPSLSSVSFVVEKATVLNLSAGKEHSSQETYGSIKPQNNEKLKEVLENLNKFVIMFRPAKSDSDIQTKLSNAWEERSKDYESFPSSYTELEVFKRSSTYAFILNYLGNSFGDLKVVPNLDDSNVASDLKKDSGHPTSLDQDNEKPCVSSSLKPTEDDLQVSSNIEKFLSVAPYGILQKVGSLMPAMLSSVQTQKEERTQEKIFGESLDESILESYQKEMDKYFSDSQDLGKDSSNLYEKMREVFYHQSQESLKANEAVGNDERPSVAPKDLPAFSKVVNEYEPTRIEDEEEDEDSSSPVESTEEIYLNSIEAVSRKIALSFAMHYGLFLDKTSLGKAVQSSLSSNADYSSWRIFLATKKASELQPLKDLDCEPLGVIKTSIQKGVQTSLTHLGHGATLRNRIEQSIQNIENYLADLLTATEGEKYEVAVLIKFHLNELVQKIFEVDLEDLYGQAFDVCSEDGYSSDPGTSPMKNFDIESILHVEANLTSAQYVADQVKDFMSQPSGKTALTPKVLPLPKNVNMPEFLNTVLKVYIRTVVLATLQSIKKKLK